MRKQEKRPPWFKVFQDQKVQIDGISDEEAGQVLKAALQYFETGETIEMSPVVRVVFLPFKKHIDESYQDYKRTCAKNRENVMNRWGKQNGTNVSSHTTGTNGNDWIQDNTEEE